MSLRTLAVLSFCVLLAACSKVTQENYSSCTWGDAKTFISVQYAADKVVLFSAQGLE